MSPTTRRPANVVNLLGQRFHASVGIFYVGLGMVLCNALRDWISNARNWVTPLALLMMIGGFVWWVVVWRQTRGQRPAL